MPNRRSTQLKVINRTFQKKVHVKNPDFFYPVTKLYIFSIFFLYFYGAKNNAFCARVLDAADLVFLRKKISLYETPDMETKMTLTCFYKVHRFNVIYVILFFSKNVPVIEL